jgi:hypothetical protein
MQNEIVQNKESKKIGAILAIALVVMIAVPVTLFAIPAAQVFRYTGSPVTFTGACCQNWNESVSVTEPATVVPVTVDFNLDYQATGEGWVGLMLNGGTCNVFHGPNRLPEFNLGTGGSGPFGDVHYQWIITPADGLKAGKNTIGVCGGGSLGNTATIVLGFNTLVVRGGN